VGIGKVKLGMTQAQVVRALGRERLSVTGHEALEVSVRTQYERLPEYAPGWRDQCGDAWAQAKVPHLRQK
jgi:hypothetical protein